MDTEAQIAENLKKNIPVPAPEPNSVTEPVQPERPDDTGFVNDMGETTDMYRLYDYFGVDQAYRDQNSEYKIQEIYRWASNMAQSSDYVEVVNVITSYMSGMGIGAVGQSQLARMYEFVRLDKQINNLKQQQGIL